MHKQKSQNFSKANTGPVRSGGKERVLTSPGHMTRDKMAVTRSHMTKDKVSVILAVVLTCLRSGLVCNIVIVTSKTSQEMCQHSPKLLYPYRSTAK